MTAISYVNHKLQARHTSTIPHAFRITLKIAILDVQSNLEAMAIIRIQISLHQKKDSLSSNNRLLLVVSKFVDNRHIQ